MIDMIPLGDSEISSHRDRKTDSFLNNSTTDPNLDKRVERK